jgi:hypothetical protein
MLARAPVLLRLTSMSPLAISSMSRGTAPAAMILSMLSSVQTRRTAPHRTDTLREAVIADRRQRTHAQRHEPTNKTRRKECTVLVGEVAKRSRGPLLQRDILSANENGDQTLEDALDGAQALTVLV